MGDLMLKSLMDQCAEVLIHNPDYICPQFLPEDLCLQLSKKAVSYDEKAGFSYHIKEPEYSTSFEGLSDGMMAFFDAINTCRGKKNKIPLVYQLFDFVIKEKNALYNSGKNVECLIRSVKRKMIQFHVENGLEMKQYWEDLFKEPFPESSKWNNYYNPPKEVTRMYPLVDSSEEDSEYEEY